MKIVNIGCDPLEVLVTRVLNGFLFHATKEQIKEQLLSEGICPTFVETALVRGERAARVRLGLE